MSTDKGGIVSKLTFSGQASLPGLRSGPGIRPVFEWVFPNQGDPAMICFFPDYDPGLNGHLRVILASHAGFLENGSIGVGI